MTNAKEMTSTTTQFTNAAGGTAVVGGGVIAFLTENTLLIGMAISFTTLLIYGASRLFDAWLKWDKRKRDLEEGDRRKEFLERED